LRIHRKWTAHAALGIVIIAAISFFALSLNRTLNPNDEGLLLHNFHKAANGQVPHRDFYDVYGPGIYWVGGALFKVFGTRILVIRVFLAVLKTAMAVLIFLIARKFMSLFFSMGAGVLFILNWGDIFFPIFNIPYAGHVNHFFLLLGIYLMILYVERDSRIWLWGVSACVGFAMLFKFHTAVFGFIGFVVFLSLKEQVRDAAQTPMTAPGKDAGQAFVFSLRALKFLGAVGVMILYLALFMPYHLDLPYFFMFLLPLYTILFQIALGDLSRFRNDRENARSRRRLRKYYAESLILAAGALIFCGAVVVYYLLVGGLDAFLYDMFVLPSRLDYYQPMKNYRLHAGLAAGLILLILGVAHGGRILGGRRSVIRAAYWWSILATTLLVPIWLLMMGVPLATWHARMVHLLAPVTLLLVACLFVPELRRTTHRGTAAREMLIIALLYICACQGFLMSFPRTDEAHIQLNATIIFILVVFLMERMVRGWERVIPNSGRRRGQALTVACLAMLALPSLWSMKMFYFFDPELSALSRRSLPHAVLHHIEAERTYPVAPLNFSRSAGLRVPMWIHPPLPTFLWIDQAEIVRFLRDNTEEQEKIFLLCEPQIIYFLAERESFLPKENYFVFLAAKGFIDNANDVKLSDAEFLEQLLQAPPEFIIRTREEKDTKRIYAAWPRTAQFIQRNYTTVKRVGIFYEILQFRGSSSFDVSRQQAT
jgi:hypothetical protein